MFSKSSSSPDLAPVIEEMSLSMSNGKLSDEGSCQQMHKDCKTLPGVPSENLEDAESESSEHKHIFKCHSVDSEQLAVNVRIEDAEVEKPPGSPPISSASLGPRSDYSKGHSPLVSPNTVHSADKAVSPVAPGSPRPSSSQQGGVGSQRTSPRSGTKTSSPPGAVPTRSRHASILEPSSSPITKVRHISIPEPGDEFPTQDRERSQTISVSSPQRHMIRTSSLPLDARRPGSFDVGFPNSVAGTPTKPSLQHGGVSPAFLFLQLYHSSLMDCGPGRPLELPQTQVRLLMSVKTLHHVFDCFKNVAF